MQELPITALLLHQRSAPLDARERVIDLLASEPERADRVVLATCHRVEVYVSGVGHADELAGVWRGIAGGAVGRACGTEAVAHLFSVAAGLDSAVQGEPQILRQVRATLASAPAALDPLLRRLLERALGVGRALRGRAGVARASRSVGSLAVDEVARLVGDPARSTVLVVGAGEMGKLAVRALSRRFGRVLVANRDRARAEALAASSGATAIGLDEIAAHLDGIGAIVSAADTRGAVLTRDLLAPRVARGPLALIDIAVPRSVAADARDLDGLAYRSVDDLGGAVALTSREAARARAACAAAADEFAREAGERSAARAIGDLRAHADALRAHQLERALRRLGHLSARDRRVVEALAARVTNSLLHAPTVALRRSPERSDDTLALFGVGRGER